MDYKEKKRFLTIHRNNIFKIQKLKAQLQKTKDALGVKGISYNSMPSSNGFTHEDLMIEKIDLEERITKLRVDNQRRKKTIESAIDKMEKKQFADIIDLYFLKGFDIVDVAVELGKHSRTIERNLKKAIEEIEL